MIRLNLIDKKGRVFQQRRVKFRHQFVGFAIQPFPLGNVAHHVFNRKGDLYRPILIALLDNLRADKYPDRPRPGSLFRTDHMLHRQPVIAHGDNVVFTDIQVFGDQAPQPFCGVVLVQDRASGQAFYRHIQTTVPLLRDLLITAAGVGQFDQDGLGDRPALLQTVGSHEPPEHRDFALGQLVHRQVVSAGIRVTDGI